MALLLFSNWSSLPYPGPPLAQPSGARIHRIEPRLQQLLVLQPDDSKAFPMH